MPFPDEQFAHGVVVSPARDSWASEAVVLVDQLRRLVPEASYVDHIGSTAVPGLPAKDCLDLMIRVERLDESITHALAGAGFRLRPEEWNRREVTDGQTLPKLVFAGAPGSRLVNVHVRLTGGANARYALLFRDFLHADSPSREAWGAFKTRLAESVTDLNDYGQIKATVQPLLMSAAERWATESGWSPE